MKNLGNMMKQAQQMQEKMAALQTQLAEMTVQGTAGGGMVTCTLSGKGEVKGITLDPQVVQPQETEMLEDLIVAAFNDGKVKLDQMVQEKMAEITGGLQLPPGMKLPF